MLDSKRSAIINKVKAVNFIGREGNKFKSVVMLLKEVGAQVEGTDLNYKGYQIFFISSRLDELLLQEIEAARLGPCLPAIQMHFKKVFSSELLSTVFQKYLYCFGGLGFSRCTQLVGANQAQTFCSWAYGRNVG